MNHCASSVVRISFVSPVGSPFLSVMLPLCFGGYGSSGSYDSLDPTRGKRRENKIKM